MVVHLATKLAQAGIYTGGQVREVARLWVERKGNDALSATISPAKDDFARCYAAALEAWRPASRMSAAAAIPSWTR